MIRIGTNEKRFLLVLVMFIKTKRNNIQIYNYLVIIAYIVRRKRFTMDR